jgi:hypothetical protein
LRLSVAKSRSRIEALGIKSEQVDRFVNALWFNPEIEFRFRRKRFRSVELTIEAFDLLSQTAARYGRRGRKIFVVNQEPIVNANPADRMPDLGGGGRGIGRAINTLVGASA